MEKPWPFISVVVPTYERAGPLAACIGALAGQDYPRDRYEIVVVDDGSATSPQGSIDIFRDQLEILFLKQIHAGPAAARNYGAAQAKGAFLAFTDDDCIPDRGWLRSLATALLSSPDSVVGGRTTNELADNPYSAASQLLVDYLYVRWNPDDQHATFFTSNNLAVPVEPFKAVGGFDVGWTCAAGEDRDLCDRLSARGNRLIYASAAVVRHAHLHTWRTFWRQHRNYGRGAYRLHRVRASREGRGIRVESPAFYLAMLTFPFSRTRLTKAALLVGLMAIAQAATAAGWVAACLEAVTRVSPRIRPERENISGFPEA